MKTIVLPDIIYYELEDYLQQKLINAESNLETAQKNYNYYCNIEEHKRDLEDELDYCLEQVNRYKVVLKNFT
jgi:hypothetical protein